METLATLFTPFETQYVDRYKDTWIKAKLTSSDDLLVIASALKGDGFRSLVTVSPTDFPDTGTIELNYFFEDLHTKRNVWLKCDIPRILEACEIQSLTPLFLGANWHEREAFSMFGVRFINHPDLRPIIVSEDFVGKTPFRRDFDWHKHDEEMSQNIQSIVTAFKEEQMNNAINLDSESSETVLNWGPTHPASGPIRLRVHCDGEEIISIDPDIGYVWRALEHLVTQKDFIGSIVAVERLCFMDNINSMTGYCMAVEEIANVEITEFAKWMRVLLGEVARVSSHFVGLGTFFNNMGLHTLFMWNMDIREFFLDFLESYSGARIATAAIEPGGVRYTLEMTMLDELQKALDKFDAGIDEIYTIFVKNTTMKMRAAKVGVLSGDEVEEYSLCGIVARASGIETDIRIDEPYAAYDQLELKYLTRKGGAALDRFTLIYEELKQSVEIIKQAKNRLIEGVKSGAFDPNKDHLVKVPKKLPKGEAISRVEWARGEVLMHLVSEEKGTNPYRLKIKAPSFNHTMMLNHLLEGQTLSDIPLIFGSLYICQGDLDR